MVDSSFASVTLHTMSEAPDRVCSLDYTLAQSTRIRAQSGTKRVGPADGARLIERRGSRMRNCCCC
jgi:hypothetical protein